MNFRGAAALMLPADGGVIVDAGEDWSAAPPAEPGVWGREPTWMPARAGLARYAVRRERALARLRRGRRAVAVHRWPPPMLEAPPRSARLSWLRAGVVVELDARGERVLDVAARAAGLDGRPRLLHFGAGGQVSARSGHVVLRAALIGSPVDPAPGADALERLEALALPVVPRPLGRGRTDVAAWASESLLPGERARSLTPELVAAVADFCLQLPRQPAPPTAFADDIASLVEQLPGYAPELRALEARIAPVVATLPSVLRHGDLWLGNLLVERGALSGVVDWDAWHPASLPGTDLLHLVASSCAFATRRSFGELMAERPWEHALFTRAADRYWRGLGIDPACEVLEAVGAAWWAATTRANLQRHPGTAHDPRWLARSVDTVLRP